MISYIWLNKSDSGNLSLKYWFLIIFVEQSFKPDTLPRAAARARGAYAEAGTPTSPPPLPSTLPPGEFFVATRQLMTLFVPHLRFAILIRDIG